MNRCGGKTNESEFFGCLPYEKHAFVVRVLAYILEDWWYEKLN